MLQITAVELSKFIDEIGVAQFARRFGVTERAALSYKYGTRRPRPAVAHRIINDSPVTWEGIYAVRPVGRAA